MFYLSYLLTLWPSVVTIHLLGITIVPRFYEGRGEAFKRESEPTDNRFEARLRRLKTRNFWACY